QEPEAYGPDARRNALQILPGGEDAVIAGESHDLHAERAEGGDIHQGEQPQEYPGGPRLARRDDVRPPHRLGEPGEEAATIRDETVEAFAQRGEPRNARIAPRPRSAPRGVGERAEDRFRALRPPAVGLDQLDGAPEALDRDVGEVGRDLLKRGDIEAVPGPPPPARDPAAAEAAVTVEDEKGPGRVRHGPRYREAGWDSAASRSSTA